MTRLDARSADRRAVPLGSEVGQDRHEVEKLARGFAKMDAVPRHESSSRLWLLVYSIMRAFDLAGFATYYSIRHGGSSNPEFEQLPFQE